MALKIIKWSDDYKTGIRIIDNDHRQLFELTEALGVCAERGEGRKRMGEIIDRLVNYANEHFVREEQFMATCGFPDYEAHVAEHRRATEEIYGIRHLFRADADGLDAMKVAQFFAHWLAEHIRHRDQRYVPYVRGDDDAMADGPPVSIRTPAEASATRLLETVSVEVPGDRAELVRVAARILAAGGAPAEKLGEILDKLASRSPSEKRLEAIAARYRRHH
ncbi:MAG: bacteriohemerythrin [Magnetovibrio sp.]|nr:bacteriohemerythrin [Magnetovibrio sp.]